jgi:hypothetical protein
MFKWTTLLWTGLASCLTLFALNAPTAVGCVPPQVNDTVQVTGLKADDEYVKETTQVEARGRLSAIYLRCLKPASPGQPGVLVPGILWKFSVNGKTYTLSIASPELERLARTLDGKVVLLSGELRKDTIVVKDLKAAR